MAVPRLSFPRFIRNAPAGRFAPTRRRCSAPFGPGLPGSGHSRRISSPWLTCRSVEEGRRSALRRFEHAQRGLEMLGRFSPVFITPQNP